VRSSRRNFWKTAGLPNDAFVEEVSGGLAEAICRREFG
jgi:hypothetical protein